MFAVLGLVGVWALVAGSAVVYVKTMDQLFAKAARPGTDAPAI